MASLAELYNKKRQYEDLRPTLVACKDHLVRASNSLRGVLNSLLSCLTIDEEGYKHIEYEKQKNNIDRNINTIDNAIRKLDNSYNSLCNQITSEESRIKNAKQTANSSKTTRSTSKSSASGKTTTSNKTSSNKKVRGYSR